MAPLSPYSLCIAGTFRDYILRLGRNEDNGTGRKIKLFEGDLIYNLRNNFINNQPERNSNLGRLDFHKEFYFT